MDIDDIEWIKNLPIEERKQALMAWIQRKEQEGVPVHFVPETELEIEVEQE